jgi:hypothetical protein
LKGGPGCFKISHVEELPLTGIIQNKSDSQVVANSLRKAVVIMDKNDWKKIANGAGFVAVVATVVKIVAGLMAS